jgi:anti-sigma B factor antagonist
MQAFKLSERELRPGCREIRVEGELDLSVADRLREALDRAGTEASEILIALDACDFIDSTGIAVIVHAHRQLVEEGKRLAVCAPSSQVLRVLSVTGLTDNGLVFESVDAALAVPGQAG